MGADAIGIGKTLGASSPDALTVEDALTALETFLGIPGGLIPAGGAASAVLPAIANLGTTEGSLYNALTEIVLGGAGAVLNQDEWEYEVPSTIVKNTTILRSALLPINGTTGEAPLATWATDNTVTLDVSGKSVARSGTAADTDLLGTYSASPPQIQFNRDLFKGQRIRCRANSIVGPSDLIFVPPLTLGAGVTTFEADAGWIPIIGDPGANTIATITGTYAVTGLEIDLYFQDALITITDTAATTANTVNLAGGNFTSAQYSVLTLKHDGTKWYEKSRSVN